MTPPSPDQRFLENQLQNSFGRLTYSHKVHEKMSERCRSMASLLRHAEILLSAVTTSSLLVVLVKNSDAAAITGAVFSTVSLMLMLYTKEWRLTDVAQQHSSTANSLWLLRERYLSLMVELKMSSITLETALERRNSLALDLSDAYKRAPRSSAGAFRSARRALKLSLEDSFTEEELNQLMPSLLRERDS